MQNKMRQVTDGIHGTIYISDIEHQMMSTPFFYRLNDVYQSSTVYMTFPSNRTKRYEHSLGTMELASKMFYSAVTNSSTTDKKEFINHLLQEFDKLLNLLGQRNKLKNTNFYQSVADTLSKLIPKNSCNMQDFLELINEAIGQGFLFDTALCKQEVCFFDLLSKDDEDPIKKIPLYSFLYQSALEALRIAALFHDIGHPPFSHIIEFTLQRLYNDKDSNKYISTKIEEFTESFKKYVNCEPIENLLLCSERAEKGDPALHEQIGLDILYNAFRGVMKNLFDKWSNDTRNKSNRIQAIYLITVIEFTFGILFEKSSIFEALHRIIDGPVDADRLDYIVRDSLNAGVNWGTIPYERLISSIKFVKHNDGFILAFPEKVTDDLDDLIVNRYKIFQRINYHHKTVKTSELMQRAVEVLAKDYLSSEQGNEIVPEIKDLWCPLGYAFGQSEVENQISKWTDSWLISVLNNALIRLSDTDGLSKLINEEIGRTEKELENLCMMLEELLLNRKKFFPLLKRQRDAIVLKDKIQKRANISEENLQKLVTHEYDKLIKETDDKSTSAQESLYRINILREHILGFADIGLLDYFFYGTNTCKSLIKNRLEEALHANDIKNYFLCPNYALKKLGVNENTKIYLYRTNGDVYKYDVNTTLKRKLLAQRAGGLWMYVYVSLPELSEEDAEKRVESLSEDISNIIGDSLYTALDELFDFNTVINSV